MGLTGKRYQCRIFPRAILTNKMDLGRVLPLRQSKVEVILVNKETSSDEFQGIFPWKEGELCFILRWHERLLLFVRQTYFTHQRISLQMPPPFSRNFVKRRGVIWEFCRSLSWKLWTFSIKIIWFSILISNIKINISSNEKNFIEMSSLYFHLIFYNPGCLWF